MKSIAIIFENQTDCVEAQKYLISRGVSWNDRNEVQNAFLAACGGLIIKPSLLNKKPHLKYSSDRSFIEDMSNHYQIVKYEDDKIWKRLVDEMKVDYLRNRMSKEVQVVQNGQ